MNNNEAKKDKRQKEDKDENEETKKEYGECCLPQPFSS